MLFCKDDQFLSRPRPQIKEHTLVLNKTTQSLHMLQHCSKHDMNQSNLFSLHLVTEVPASSSASSIVISLSDGKLSDHTT
jgi:hypothetical protein